MTGIESVLTEIDAVGRHLNRRTFLMTVTAALVPQGALDGDDERFFRRVTATLVPDSVLCQTGIDPVKTFVTSSSGRGRTTASALAR